MSRLCLVTGANRGIGFEIARSLASRGHRVLIGARRQSDGARAAEALRRLGLDIEAIRLDVTEPESVSEAARELERREGRLDILINNAGILIDSTKRPDDISLDEFRRTIDTNLVGPFLVTKAFAPLLLRSDDARIVNISTDLAALGQASNSDSPFDAVLAPSYRVSKAALNMLALTWAKRLRDTNVSVSVCSPGWCRTGLDSLIDSSKAPYSAEEGADTAVWLALDVERSAQHGRFFAKRREIAW
ncbi:MAG TPA: SDR family oxidoreductase [Methylosinus sp.]|jgi:NAD(P)-dependent dehydrogenase (short-subunit alcohol dehydrogenase family)|uniref:SDR family oxidoreductase n=1 Tax=Methylosinus sp. TaxID=427 RepID=UPI002F92F156